MNIQVSKVKSMVTRHLFCKRFKVSQLAVYVVLLFIISYFLFIQSRTQMIHVDEHTFVRRSTFLNFLVNKNLNREIWESFDSYDVPMFPQFAYAIPFYFIGENNIAEYLKTKNFYQLDEEKSNDFYWWGKYAIDYYEDTFSDLPIEIQMRAEPILMARYMAVLFSLFSIIFFFLTLKDVYGWHEAAIGVIFLLNNELFVRTSVRAMAEAPLLSTMIILLYLSNHLLKSLSLKTLIISGFVFGIAVSTKYNAMIHFFFIAPLLLLRSVRNIEMKGTYRKLLFFFKSLLLFSFVALLTFILLNPFTWFDTRNIFTMLQFKVASNSDIQREFASDALMSSTDKIFSTIYQTVSKKGFANPVSDSPAYYITGMLLAFGLINQVLRKEKVLFARVFVVFWSLSIIAFSTIWIPVSWDRYYILNVPANIILCIEGWYFLTRILRNFRSIQDHSSV